jgi:hypothetical protein
MAWTANVTPYVKLLDSGSPFTGANLSTSMETPVGNATTAITNGTGANAINLGWFDQRSYGTGGTTLDLTALAAASTNSGSATFTAVKVLKIKNEDTTNTLVVGNAASVQFTPGFSAATTTITIQPGQTALFTNLSAAGWDCTTNKNLKIASGASTVSATISIAGLD